jgi:hypothetical protein
VVELGGSTMFARIGVMQALNRHHVRESNPSRKEPHWGHGESSRGINEGVLQRMACHLRQAKSREERQPVAALYAICFRGYVKQFTRQGRSRAGGPRGCGFFFSH